ncbi:MULTISPECIES: 4-(cytidine 5'-diphospho)-2-C-methyl-D-erythritol kinase [unclassified Arsukibacterium]|uniref:4-(cytidine 5'-diphospho)-2-C-methyl-D-erythritol kinase n=1 Tax=unclassified Arsukibacterium TaxID=2635278 RepID=UPI000C8A7DC6|nr:MULTISPECIES: 4-(cytidine 5'-diphospho)-2-C-methyl-D-erythritol kinase [unclassified Arsukibacterium]MAA95410.1 4-(cytidine 5'-diphospho)-2-C-methyl-D-erythritol kinase [Rheinheimera sp.]|tara:strand:+ start:42279 stop:43130 length:852 start_codon:yes stop_codon:yes gene_type:complete
MTLSLPAVAKLNLFLHITGRRHDGYHNLQTLFQLLDVGDQLHFTLRHDNKLTLQCNDLSLQGADNLIIKAAVLLQQHTGCSRGCDIILDKNLPMGGGLGGGSSDAATTLLALNVLWQLNLSTPQLAALALTLGADVPLFVWGRSAFAEGIGEKLVAVDLPEKIYLVVTPPCHISTAEIFQHPDLTRNSRALSLDTLFNSPWRNDCQPLVEQLQPIVAITLQWLVEYAPCRMTGTGASVFAEFPDTASAQHALANLPPNCRGFIAKGVNQSPVMAALADTEFYA